MAPEGRRAAYVCAVAIAAFLLTPAPPAHALRVLDYNILNWPGSSGPTREQYFRTVIGPISPDIMVAEEVTSQSGVFEFLNNVLDVLEPAQWAAAPFVDGNDTDAALFYKPAKFEYLGEWAFYVDSPILRLVHVYRVRPVGYTTNGADIRFYAVHLKASKGFESQRLAEATALRDSMNQMPTGTHGFAVGDFNLYTGTEPALSKFLEVQADDDGRLYDPLGLQGVPWQDNASIALRHTQSPCLTQGDPNCGSGAASGGLDDRFDLILPTLNWNDGQGYELILSTYISVGNDGLHLNHQLIDPPTIPEGATYAAALQKVSDHLPLRVDIQVPAISSVASSLDLGTVIVGGGADLAVANTATPPADGLTYTLAAPSGFTAPGGGFDVAPGGSATHAIGTALGPPFGSRSGDLALSSDDVDQPTRSVALTANVLDHAHASLDSTSDQTAGTIDWGTLPAEQFTPITLSAFNNGYSAQQARLSLTGAVIAGGSGHFSIAGFGPALIAGTPGRYDVAFDTTGTTRDSTYTATLTLSSEDESLPGAQPQPDLVVTLSARVGGAPTAAPALATPGRTRLYTPFPNPISGTSRVGLDLASRADVQLEIVDLAGRRVTTLAHRSLEPGRYSFQWSGRDDGNAPVQAGVYFVRLTGTGVVGQAKRFAVVR